MEKSRHALFAVALTLLAGCSLTPPAFTPPPELSEAEAIQWRAGCDSGVHVASFGRLGAWSASTGPAWSRGYVTCRDRYVLLQAKRRE